MQEGLNKDLPIFVWNDGNIKVLQHFLKGDYLIFIKVFNFLTYI